MKMQKLTLFSIALSFLVISSCTTEKVESTDLTTAELDNEETIYDNAEFGDDYSHLSQERRITLPQDITFTAPGLYPEGIEYDFRRNRFYVSSFSQGTIGIVSTTGEYTPFIEDDILQATLGLHIDNVRDIIYVTIADFFDLGNVAGVAGYDLKTGERVLYADLLGVADGDTPLPNDLITDSNGDLYITDSSSAVIYKVDRRTQEPTVYLDDDALISELGFGLNGITYNPLGFFLVATRDAKLFRIPLNRPTSFTEIPVTPGAYDGLQITGFNTIYGVSRDAGEVVKLESTDFFRSNIEATEIIPTEGGSPTTLTVAYSGALYVINASLGDFINGTEPVIQEFTIERVK